MKFIEYTDAWAKSEVYQGKLMIGIGIRIAIALILIFHSDNIFLKGAVIPIGILLAILLGMEVTLFTAVLPIRKK